jgi:hypothetical protein
MLILICSAVIVKDQRLRAVLIASSIVLKVYSLLLLGGMLAAQRFRLVLYTVLSAVLLVLPFHSLVLPYVVIAVTRTAQFTAVENLSPAVILGSLCKHLPGKLIFITFWAGSLLRASWRHRELPFEERLIVCFPWMAALPLQVYPYTGILLLPVLAWKIGSLHTSTNKIERRMFLAGFILVGTQQAALNEYFRWLVRTHRFFPFLNMIGMVCILMSLAIGATVRNKTLVNVLK